MTTYNLMNNNTLLHLRNTSIPSRDRFWCTMSHTSNRICSIVLHN